MKKGDGLDRIRPENANKVVRFSLLDFLKPRGGRSHFVTTKEGKSKRLCLSLQGETVYCCQKLDEEGQYHVVNLALEYTNANPKNGKYEKDANGKLPPIEWRIGYVDLSRPNFRSVSGLAEEGDSIYDYDLVMALNARKYEFNVKSRKARWKSNPELVKEVEAAVQRFIQDGGKKLASKLGKKTSLIEWKALLAGAQAGAAEANLDDVEDL